MEAEGALVVSALILESISNPPWGVSWSWVGCGCHNDPISEQITTCLILRIDDIKLRLLCGVSIKQLWG